MNRSFARKLTFATLPRGIGAEDESPGEYDAGTVALALVGGLIVGAVSMHYLMKPVEQQRAPAFVPPPPYVPPPSRMQEQYALNMQDPAIQKDIARARAMTKFQKGHAMLRSEIALLEQE